jgi:hypothetical protein
MEPDLIKRVLYSLGALAFLAIFATGSVDSKVDSNTSQSSSATAASPTPSRAIVHSGETGVLRMGDSTSAVVLGSDKEANDELIKMAVNHDQEGFAMMMLSGRAFSVPAGTKVRVLDTLFSFGFLPTGRKVRVLEGTHYGRVGFVPSEWVLPASSIKSATPWHAPTPIPTATGPANRKATPEIRKAKPVLSSSPFAGQKASDTAKPGIKFPLSRIIGQPESIVNKVLGNPDKYHKLPPGDGYQGFGDFPNAVQVSYPDGPTWTALTTVFSRSKLMFIQLNFKPNPMSEEELFTALGLGKANFVVIKSLPGEYGGTQYRGTIDKHVIEIAAWRPTDGPGFCGMVTIELVTPQSSKRAT